MRLRNLRAQLSAAHDEIDSLGTLAEDITRNCDCDMKACFASNTLYAVDALLREIETLVRK